MLKKIFSAVMCGVYISLGATAFLLISDPVMGALFFASGIFLVNCFCNMLLTRVFPLFALNEYNFLDIIIAFLGNSVGAAIYAALINATRLSEKIAPKLNSVMEAKLGDTYLSIFIMAIFCGFMVACACLATKVFKDNKGLGIFLSMIFVAVFVICGFDHAVANAFYFAFYSLDGGFTPELLIITLIVFIGNGVGGIGAGYMYKYNAKQL